jgi:putative PIN family toxin of toxin-antitoxin system
VRVVFDTVVLVRGLIDPFNWSGKLIFEWHGAYEWVVSPEIVNEYLEVNHRPRLGDRFKPRENRDLNTVLMLISAATPVYPTEMPFICRDPSDDKFLAAAETGKADFIVSEDNDLLSLVEYKGVRICTAEAVLHLLLQELGRDSR